MTAAILDVDGTLVDTNYHHAIAWYRAFKEHDIVIPVWKIHRHIGMGGDQLVAKANDDEGVMVGDSTFDCEAAKKRGYRNDRGAHGWFLARRADGRRCSHSLRIGCRATKQLDQTPLR